MNLILNLWQIYFQKHQMTLFFFLQFVVSQGNTVFTLDLPINFYGRENVGIFNEVSAVLMFNSVSIIVGLYLSINL